MGPHPDEEIQFAIEEQAREEQHQEELQAEEYRKLEEEEYWRAMEEAGMA